jgi:hypothetical protein
MLRGLLVWRSGALVAVALLAVVAGCGGDQEEGEAGSDCYRDADCKSGLVCVPNAAGERVCSSDTTPLVSQVPGPPAPADPDAGVPDGG